MSMIRYVIKIVWIFLNAIFDSLKKIILNENIQVIMKITCFGMYGQSCLVPIFYSCVTKCQILDVIAVSFIIFLIMCMIDLLIYISSTYPHIYQLTMNTKLIQFMNFLYIN